LKACPRGQLVIEPTPSHRPAQQSWSGRDDPRNSASTPAFRPLVGAGGTECYGEECERVAAREVPPAGAANLPPISQTPSAKEGAGCPLIQEATVSLMDRRSNRRHADGVRVA